MRCTQKGIAASVSPATTRQLRGLHEMQNHASDRALPYQKPPRLHPTHRLAKEMRARGVQAQTYYSFLRWSGQTDWTLGRMGQFIPRVIIWDVVCTVPRPTLKTFLDCLEGRGVQVICCGDQGQPPPIAGEMPHDCLRGHAAYYRRGRGRSQTQRPPSEGPQKGHPSAARQDPVPRGTKGAS